MERYQALVDPFERLLRQVRAESVRVSDIQAQPLDADGYSGAEIRAYRVRFLDARGQAHTMRVVTKNATLLERRILARFSRQGQAIPAVDVPDVTLDDRALVAMLYAGDRPAELWLGHPDSPFARQVAQRLARIHVTNLGCPFDGLPLIDERESRLRRLHIQETFERWAENMQDEAFAREFGPYETRLFDSLERFLQLLGDLDDRGDTQTVISTDLIPSHIRVLDGLPVFIDWEQAVYGSFFLDLPNYFTLESVLLYRDALAELGHVIPPAEFVEMYREVGRYMGLRYLEVGLGNWQRGGEARRQGRWFLFYTLTLALRGR